MIFSQMWNGGAEQRQRADPSLFHFERKKHRCPDVHRRFNLPAFVPPNSEQRPPVCTRGKTPHG
jgi:hypothetical protein